MDRQRIGKNDPPLSATPKERARPLSCLEEFEISYCTRTNNFVAFYKEPNRAFICYLGTDNPPEETI